MHANNEIKINSCLPLDEIKNVRLVQIQWTNALSRKENSEVPHVAELPLL